eukprot:755928-Hanusia_phi.AAC.4
MPLTSSLSARRIEAQGAETPTGRRKQLLARGRKNCRGTVGKAGACRENGDGGKRGRVNGRRRRRRKRKGTEGDMEGKNGKSSHRRADLRSLANMVKEFPGEDKCMASLEGLEQLSGGKESKERMTEIIQIIRVVYQYVEGAEERRDNETSKTVHASMLNLTELCGKTWREIHHGNWREVSNSWRELFAICCMMNAIIWFLNDMETFPAVDFKDCECIWWTEPRDSIPAELLAARWIDLALLFGGETNRVHAHRMLEAIVEDVRDVRRGQKRSRECKRIKLEESRCLLPTTLTSVDGCKRERIPILACPSLLTFKLEYLDVSFEETERRMLIQ